MKKIGLGLLVGVVLIVGALFLVYRRTRGKSAAAQAAETGAVPPSPPPPPPPPRTDRTAQRIGAAADLLGAFGSLASGLRGK